MPGPSRREEHRPSLEAAQATQPPLAAVLPLHPRAASDGPATPAPPEGPGPVTRLPVPGPDSPGGPGHPAGQGMPRHEPEDTLTCITSDIFRAGLTLQRALGQPEGALRQAAEQVLELLDGTVRDARAAAFAWLGPGTAAHPAAGRAGAVLRPAAEAVSRPLMAGSADNVRLSRLRASEARQACARSQQTRARALEVIARSAATQDRVAAAFSVAAASDPRRAADLRALSHAAASRAARMRGWARAYAAG